KHAGTGADCPFWIGRPGDSKTRGEVIVVAIHEAVAEPSVLDKGNVRPAHFQSRIRIARTLTLPQEDRETARIGDVRSVVKSVVIDRGQVSGDVFPGRAILIAQPQGQGEF